MKLICEENAQNSAEPGLNERMVWCVCGLSNLRFSAEIVSIQRRWVSVFDKRKMQIDPERIKLLETRKRNKLRKAITELKKFSRRPKPVEEVAMSLSLRESLPMSVRQVDPISDEEREMRILSLRAYSTERASQCQAERKHIEMMLSCQEKALGELKSISPFLYQAAVQVDESMLNVQRTGPAESLPFPKYTPPDGDYVNTTKKWEGE